MIGIALHTHIFGSHLAVLDPITGLGVLVLPQPVTPNKALTVSANREAATTIGRRWFGTYPQSYSASMHRLEALGWQLPRNNHTTSVWFDAGTTACCGRQMISLICPAVEEVLLPLDVYTDATQQIIDAAAKACCQR